MEIVDYTDPERTIDLLDELQKLGFGDEAFAHLHHWWENGRRETIKHHRGYCEKMKTTFRVDDSNALVQRRLEMVRNKFKESATPGRNPTTFVHLADEAFRLVPPVRK
jgi:hypothetical protein